jgi:prepilin-type processing-associated H-X9-DG protein
VSRGEGAGSDRKRAVMGNFNKDGMNHKGGSEILFADSHVKRVEMDEAGRHPNPHLPDIDPDIYAIDTEPRHPDDADLD